MGHRARRRPDLVPLLTASVSLDNLRNRWQSSLAGLVTNELHGYARCWFVFIVVHVLAVTVDPLRTVWQPSSFRSRHYRPIWMGLGIVALYLLLAVWVSTRLRHRIGHRLWKIRLAFAVTGGDAARPRHRQRHADNRAVALYATSVGLVGTLLAIRLLAPAGRDGVPPAAASPLASLSSPPRRGRSTGRGARLVRARRRHHSRAAFAHPSCAPRAAPWHSARPWCRFRSRRGTRAA